MNNLIELLEIVQATKRNKAIRERLKPCFEPIKVDGHEKAMLCILLNMGYSSKEDADLTDLKSAQFFLKGKKHFGKTITEAKWIHTHNLKYPDIRVSKQTIRIPLPEDVEGVCSQGSTGSIDLGWSHNAEFVSKSAPLIVEFSWKKQVTCLLNLLSNTEPFWISLLLELGVTKRWVNKTLKELGNITASYLPNEVDHYSPQLRFPFRGNYISITPVTSHRLLSEVQKRCERKEFYSRYLYHPRATNAGLLTSSLGGKIAVLAYYPDKGFNNNLNEYVTHKNDSVFFNPKYLSYSNFLNALGELAFMPNRGTLKLNRIARVAAIKTIRQSLYWWLAKADDYRKHANLLLETSTEANLLQKYLNNEASNSELTSGLNRLVHEQLSQINKAKQFAYHPKLISPIKRQLQFLLRQRAIREIEASKQRVFYLHLKHLRVEDMETLSNPYLWGMPSIIAFAGFAHKFELNLKELNFHNIRIMGVACFVHSCQVTKKTSLPEYSHLKKEKYSTQIRPTRPAIVSSPKSQMEFDLVLRLWDGNDGYIPENIPNSEQIRKALPTRYAGGTLFPTIRKIDERYSISSDPRELFNSLSFLPTKGCWLYPSQFKVYSLDELSEALNADLNLRPVATGYQYLEEPKYREGSITGLHCFAENLLGLTRCTNSIEPK